MEFSLAKQKTCVLIASTNSLFRNGILKILTNRNDFQDLIIEQASDIQDTRKKYSKFKPSILILDFDDKEIKKKLFMNTFFLDRHNAQMLLVSLDQKGDVIYYDRKILSTEEAHRWLQIPWNDEKTFQNSELMMEE